VAVNAHIYLLEGFKIDFEVTPEPDDRNDFVSRYIGDLSFVVLIKPMKGLISTLCPCDKNIRERENNK